jgi:hypothetical protein
MDHSVSITVPSTVGVNQPAPADLVAEYQEKAMRLLAVCFGAFTALEGKGGYVSDDFGLVVEPVMVVSASCTAAKLEAGLPKVRALAVEMAERMTQECVAVMVDGKMELISAAAA